MNLAARAALLDAYLRAEDAVATLSAAHEVQMDRARATGNALDEKRDLVEALREALTQVGVPLPPDTADSETAWRLSSLPEAQWLEGLGRVQPQV